MQLSKRALRICSSCIRTRKFPPMSSCIANKNFFYPPPHRLPPGIFFSTCTRTSRFFLHVSDYPSCTQSSRHSPPSFLFIFPPTFFPQSRSTSSVDLLWGKNASPAPAAASSVKRILQPIRLRHSEARDQRVVPF